MQAEQPKEGEQQAEAPAITDETGAATEPLTEMEPLKRRQSMRQPLPLQTPPMDPASQQIKRESGSSQGQRSPRSQTGSVCGKAKVCVCVCVCVLGVLGVGGLRARAYWMSCTLSHTW